MDLKSCFERANQISKTISATRLQENKYFPIKEMKKVSTKFGDQICVELMDSQKVWLPNSYTKELKDEVIAAIRENEWELAFQGMKIFGRYAKAHFDVREIKQ